VAESNPLATFELKPVVNKALKVFSQLKIITDTLPKPANFH
jgi:hypothetical protein